MTSFRQIDANRRNAPKSTRPTTKSGKHRSRRNAVRHGLTAETAITTLDDEEEVARSKLFSAAIRHSTALPCLALPCLALPCLALPCLALPCLALPCLALPCLALPCLALPCLALPCLALPCLALPCLALPCLALPCLALPCLALPCLLPCTVSLAQPAGWTCRSPITRTHGF